MNRVNLPIDEKQNQELKKKLNHDIDTERFRCSCGARMCFECGWCIAQCVCLKTGKKGE
jgi:hypothetical protein